MEEWRFITGELLPALNQGLWVTLALIFPSALMGVALGCLTGAIRVYGPRPLARLGDFYANLFRGTPLLVQLFILYFGLPRLGIMLEPYSAAVLGFTLCTAAYQSEYVRGGLLSIKRSQLLAAQALGFSTLQTVISIILPQAFRRALPGVGNEIIYLIKYSSLAYTITCIELTGQGKQIASLYFKFTEVFLLVGIYYLIMVTLANWGLRRVERRLSIPGFEQRAG